MTDSNLSRRLRSYLEGRFAGRIADDERTLRRYSTDMSIFRIEPQAVLFPAAADDITAAFSFSRAESVPVTLRCGGTSTGGSAVGAGIILVLTESAELAQTELLGESDGRLRVRVGPSVRHDDLQRALAERGYFLPSDPTSGPISYIGGNVGARASGPHALRHGSIDSYVVALEAVTIDGELMDTASADSVPRRLIEGVQAISQDLRADGELAALLSRRRGLKSASGYTIDSLAAEMPTELQIAKLMCGQVGTLAAVTSVTLEALPRAEGGAGALLGFRSAAEAFAAVPALARFRPDAIEFMNREAMEIAREKGRFPAAARPAVEMATGYEAVLLVELSGAGARERMEELSRAAGPGESKRRAPVPAVAGMHVAFDPSERAALWTARKGLMPAVLNYSPRHRALSVVNDVGVPVDRLAEFVERVQAVFSHFELPAPIYGHAGNGNLHLRPLFDLDRPGLAGLVQEVAEEIYTAVVDLGGTVTGEHGMGRLRAPYLRAEWGDSGFRIMQRIKTLFDPDDLLNPGTMFVEDRIYRNLSFG